MHTRARAHTDTQTQTHTHTHTHTHTQRLAHDERGKRNWASSVRCKLYQYGFGFVWLNQGVEEMNQFLHVFRERLIQFVDGKSGIPMLRLPIYLMFIGHFAQFMR